MSTSKDPDKLGNIPEVGFVVIGRNEGERLRRCIESIIEQSLVLHRHYTQREISKTDSKPVYPIVYVDSGSTDGSVEFAHAVGCETVQLSNATPFTAARARNMGLDQLLENNPGVEWIQFVDGDCSLQPGWLLKAAAFLSVNPRVAIVCGRRREVYPQKTIYNALCDMEWETPVGETQACGGDFMARKNALKSVDAFNPALIAGEEPELCLRLRKENWTIWRIDEEMTSHDAAMTSFRQFWLRNIRAGFAYAERCVMHANRKQPYCVREVSSICIWGFLVPALAIIIVVRSPQISLLLLLAYPAMVLRIFLRRVKLRNSIRRSMVYAVLTPVGKFPQFFGVIKYAIKSVSGRQYGIIEYK